MGSAAYFTGFGFDNQQPHFLDSCSLCRRALSQNHDIFMYRGNAPFCSQECRQEQIEMDEAAEKRLNLSSKRSSKSANRQQQQTTSESAKESAVRIGSVAVA